MLFFSELERQVDILRGALGSDLDTAASSATILALGDDTVVRVLEAASALVKAAEGVRIAAAGVVSARSTREAGHGGLAQTRGHRSPVTFMQEITGCTRADAARQVRLGQTLLDANPHGGSEETEVPDAGESVSAVRPWHSVLGDALLSATISSAQHDAILRGLGEPPVRDSLAPDEHRTACIAPDAAGCDCLEAVNASSRVAWATAAEQLADEARMRTVEDLARAARTIRDILDPVGAQARFDERYEARSLRTWTDANGSLHGHLVFDDLGGAWATAVLDAALRPRRGGPRFVDPDEKSAGDRLAADPRTNDQLAYDLFLDVLRAGALADAASVFGTRQAGVRIVTTIDPFGTARGALDGETESTGIAVIEETRQAIPDWAAAQHACDTSTAGCTVDLAGNPLDLGREARLYSSGQKVALAIRDGGCGWIGCDRPAHYCEAHHIDEWARDGGRTDIDRGILLCAFHHMQLHHGGWKITRDGLGPFMLHPPGGGDPVPLPAALERRYMFGDLRPPPRFRPAA